MSGYEHRGVSLLTAHVHPVTAAWLLNKIPTRRDEARMFAGLPPELREMVTGDLARIRQAAGVYRDLQGWQPAYDPEPQQGDEPHPWVSVKVAAAELGRDPKQVRNYLHAGQLDGRQKGKLWQVSRASLDAFKIARARPQAA